MVNPAQVNEAICSGQSGRPQVRLKERGRILAERLAVGNAIAADPARVLKDPSEIEGFKSGEVLVTEITDPDWEPIMKLASAIVTERGGRTSHAAIVAGELGIAAVVGTGDATEAIQSGNPVTVSCCEGEVGHVYDGTLDYEVTQIDSATLGRPESRTMINVANPERDEIPSNVILAKEFAEIFDGFSIGSNDLTQLILGVDRDSERVAPLFEERDQAVKELCAMLIEEAHRAARKVGICGQAPSDYPEFAAFLGLKTIVARQMGQIDQVAIPSSRYA